jgi:hypothetical protein
MDEFVLQLMIGRTDTSRCTLHQGAITGCCSATVLLPSEIVKAKTQVVVGNVSASSTEIYKKMIRQSGIRVS